MRDIQFWERSGGTSPVRAYLSGLQKRDTVKELKFYALIDILAREGERAINGIDVIKMKFKDIKPPNKIIELKEKPYRIYTLLTPTHLWLLEMTHKKENKLRKEDSELIIKRAKSILTNRI